MRKKRQTLFMETTGISAEQTVQEIQKILMKGGADAIMIEYVDKQVSAVSFRVNVDGAPVPFRLPCRADSIFKIFYERKGRHTISDSVLDNMQAQARRVAWRQILRWIEAQVALVQTGMVKLEEVFLPYMHTGKDQTLYQLITNRKFNVKLLTHE